MGFRNFSATVEQNRKQIPPQLSSLILPEELPQG